MSIFSALEGGSRRMASLGYRVSSKLAYATELKTDSKIWWKIFLKGKRRPKG